MLILSQSQHVDKTHLVSPPLNGKVVAMPTSQAPELSTYPGPMLRRAWHLVKCSPGLEILTISEQGEFPFPPQFFVADPGEWAVVLHLCLSIDSSKHSRGSSGSGIHIFMSVNGPGPLCSDTMLAHYLVPIRNKKEQFENVHKSSLVSARLQSVLFK